MDDLIIKSRMRCVDVCVNWEIVSPTGIQRSMHKLMYVTSDIKKNHTKNLDSLAKYILVQYLDYS